jgi:hypothetical protein
VFRKLWTHEYHEAQPEISDHGIRLLSIVSKWEITGGCGETIVGYTKVDSGWLEALCERGDRNPHGTTRT